MKMGGSQEAIAKHVVSGFARHFFLLIHVKEKNTSGIEVVRLEEKIEFNREAN